MASAQEIQYIIKARDEATAIFQNMGAAGTQAANDLSKAFDLATVATTKNSDAVQKSQSFYQAHRAELREHSFYMREGKAAIDALSFGFLALMGSQDNASESTKKMNKSLMEGFAAFQGINFLMMSMGAGPWGMAAAAIAGVGTAIYGVISSSKEAVPTLEEQRKKVEEVWKEYDEWEKRLHGTEEANKAVTQLNLQLTNEKITAIINKIKAIEILKNTLTPTARVANGILGFLGLNQSEKELDDLNKQLKSLEVTQAALLSASNEVKPKGKFISPQDAAKEAKKLEDAKYKAKLDAFEENAALYDEQVDVQYNKEVKENEDKAKAIEKIDKDLYSKGKELAKQNYLDEARVVNDWEKSIVNDANATEEQKTRAMEIGAQERDNIVQKELKKEQKAWVDNNKEILNGVDSFYNNLAKTLEAGHVTWNAVWQDMKKVAIDMLVKEGEQLLQQTIINAAVSETSLAASVAATDTAMAAIAAAAAPAAALVSIASWGGADAAALAALTATMAATQAMAVVPKFAKGGNFTVPPGYSNDSYPMLVSSGEKVNVTPANQSGGGATVHVHINAPGTTVEMVRQAVIEGLRQTGMKVDKYLVDNRRNIILGSV